MSVSFRSLWAATAALVVVRIFWCELHGIATGTGLVGLPIAVPWALAASAGWILAAALLVRFGGHLPDSRVARLALVPAIVAITLGSETWLLAGETPLAQWLYERMPAHATFATLLVVGYLLWRGREAAAPAPAPDIFEVMTGTGRMTIRVDDVECFEADRNYINVHTGDRSYLLRQSLTSLEKSLRPGAFLRIHRSAMVNRAKVRERRAGNVLVLESGRRVRMSRSAAGRFTSHPGRD